MELSMDQSVSVVKEGAVRAVETKKVGKKPRERWTAEEHALFLEGLKTFHRDWRAIERALYHLVPT